MEELENKVNEETSNNTEVSEQETSVKQEYEHDNPVAPVPSQLGFVDQVKQIIETRRKETLGVLIALGLAIIAFVGYNFYQGQPKSLAKEVRVEFSGYSESGTLTYNEEVIAAMVKELSYKKAGFNKEQAQALAQNDPVALSALATNPQLASKASLAKAMISSVRYEFDKKSELKNGDEVTFTVTTTSQNSPVKAEKKSFKVETLKEYEKVSKEELLKLTPLSFEGFNGYGRVSIPKTKDEEDIFTIDGNSDANDLKNGDNIKLVVRDYYLTKLKKEGKVPAEKSFEVPVSGLKEVSEIKELKDILKKIDDYSKSENKNNSSSSYTLEPQGTFLGVFSSSNSAYENVIVISILYKVTETKSDGSKDTNYKDYSYAAGVKKDGSVDMDKLEKAQFNTTTDLEGLKSYLSNYKLKEYKQ